MSQKLGEAYCNLAGRALRSRLHRSFSFTMLYIRTAGSVPPNYNMHAACSCRLTTRCICVVSTSVAVKQLSCLHNVSLQL